MERFNYYFNTRQAIDAALSVPINKVAIDSVLFHLVWDAYYNVTRDEKELIAYVEHQITSKTSIYHPAAYSKKLKGYIKKMKDMPWRDIKDTIKVRKSELEYISSFNDIQVEKLLFCYLAIAKFNDMSRDVPTHWENESEVAIFKMAKVPIPASDRDMFINNMITGELQVKLSFSYGNENNSKRVDYISDDENDPVIIDLDESNYRELAFTYLNWKNGGGYKKCAKCGRLFRVRKNAIGKDDKKSNERACNAKYCRNCASEYEPKYKGKDEMDIDFKEKTIICVDCGKEVVLEKYMSGKTCRCAQCQEAYDKTYHREYMRNRRDC